MNEQIAYCPPKITGFHLDPRTKIIFMAVLTTLLFHAHEDLIFVTVAFLVPFLLLLSNKQFRTAINYGGLFLLGIVFKLTQSIYTFPDIINSIGIMLIALILRLFPTFMLGYYIIYSTKVSEFVSAMRKWHISENFIIPISVIFRFIPTIKEEARAISYAMKMREISFGTKRFWQNPSLYLEYKVVPLMMSIAKIGEELSAAALTKGLSTENQRNCIVTLGYGVYDILMYILSIGMIVWVIV